MITRRRLCAQQAARKAEEDRIAKERERIQKESGHSECVWIKIQ